MLDQEQISVEQSKGWFHIPGVQAGDRTVHEQLKGLGPLLEEVAGETVLDLGCAEGLIAGACMDAGAAAVTGIDCNPALIETAKRLFRDCDFVLYDLNHPPSAVITHALRYDCDVVLMLGIAHKMRNPEKFLREYSVFANRRLVLRLPPEHAPRIIIRNRRRARVMCDAQKVLESRGFKLERIERGHFDEWMGYFRRV